jgi:16S rRNA (adenine1518-N6/adenine1519-N6)-dimethyltransferase
MSQPVRAKKHLGQHFLCDENIAKKIADALLLKDKETPVIEVGPGTGVLTKYLIDEVDQFLALDIDEESVTYLKNKYKTQEHKIQFGDFLKADLLALFGKHFNVIGNFPYNISSQIMFRVLENRHSVRVVVGMFQKEVAQRIAEKPGTKAYGILSVLLQAFYDIEYLFTVHENVFSPQPKVKSAVIRLIRNSVQQLDCDETLFIKVVKTTFNQRRKQIRNSIKPLMTGKEGTHELLEKRPEQLSVNQFVDLTNYVSAQNKV